jgi:hypothetical protein
MIGPRKAANRDGKLPHGSRGIPGLVVLVALLAGLACALIIVPGDAQASPGYACNNNPCSEERKAYVERSARRVCALSRALTRLTTLKARKVQQLAALVGRLNACRARGPWRCQFHARQVWGMNRRIAALQRRIDALVRRTSASCRSSLPNGAPGNPPTCEETEASKYCPLADEQQAQQSLQQRCADLEAEKAQQALCVNCIDPDALAASSWQPGDFSRLAAGSVSLCEPKSEGSAS